jgi:hypothetical protein
MNLWPVLAAGSGLVTVLLVPAAITEWRNGHRMSATDWIVGYEEQPLTPDPLPEWTDDNPVRVPAPGAPHPTKRRLTGHERRFPVAFAWEPLDPRRYPARRACDGTLAW